METRASRRKSAAASTAVKPELNGNGNAKLAARSQVRRRVFHAGKQKRSIYCLLYDQDKPAAATTAQLDEEQAADDVFHSYEVRPLCSLLLAVPSGGHGDRLPGGRTATYLPKLNHVLLWRFTVRWSSRCHRHDARLPASHVLPLDLLGLLRRQTARPKELRMGRYQEFCSCFLRLGCKGVHVTTVFYLHCLY